MYLTSTWSKERGIPLRTQHYRTSSSGESNVRTGGHSRLERLPKTLPVVRKLLARLRGCQNRAESRMFAAACSLAVFEGLCAGELLALTGADIAIDADRLAVHIKSSKTDPFLQGCTVYVGNVMFYPPRDPHTRQVVWEIEYFFFTLPGSRATELQGGNRGVLRSGTQRERYTYGLVVWPYKELLTHAGLTRSIHYISLPSLSVRGVLLRKQMRDEKRERKFSRKESSEECVIIFEASWWCGVPFRSLRSLSFVGLCC